MESLGRIVTRHAPWVVLIWLLATCAANLAVPQIEHVVREHAKPFFASDSPAVSAAVQMGRDFDDSTTNNVAYVVLESSAPIGDADHQYYQHLVDSLRADRAHVESVMDLWSDPYSAAIAEGSDHRAVTMLVRLCGDIGDAQATAAVAAVRHTLDQLPRPAGLQVRLSGPGATVVDEFASIANRLITITIVTVIVIAMLLLAVYRSVTVCAVVLTTIGLALAAARALVAALGQAGVVEVSTFSVSLMAAMVLGAGTDYTIFIIGRYHEQRRRGVASEVALQNSYARTAPVLIASASTVAIALCCLVFTKIGLLRSAGIPCAIAIAVTALASLTLTPALLKIAAWRGLCEPTRSHSVRRWRRLGTAIVRWPAPIFVSASVLLLVCAVPALGLRLSYDERAGQPRSSDSNLGYQAADRHFPANSLLPQYVLIETDHDMRNPAGLIAIEGVTRHLMAIPGVRAVQSASRPTGAPPPGAALTDQAGLIGRQIKDGMSSLQTALDSIDRTETTLSQLSDALQQLNTGLAGTVDGLQRINAGAQNTKNGATGLHGITDSISEELTPLRDFVGATPDCATNTICALVDRVIVPVDAAVTSTQQLEQGTTQLVDGSDQAAHALATATTAISTTRAKMSQARQVITSLSLNTGSALPQFSQLADYLTALAADFAGSPDRGFYLPEAALRDPGFQRAARLLFSPDGHATRLLVFTEGDAWSQSAADQTARIRSAVHEATKEGTLRHNVVRITGVGAYTSDLQKTLARDMALLVTVALALIFVVALLLIRSPVAAITVVATVGLSYLSALGATVAIWTGLLGQHIHWAVPPLAFVALVAVGTDYNLLMTARLKEEAPAGLKTGMVRAFAGTGGVVTTAGVVFALTMLGLLASGVSSIAQIGTAVGIGLIIDTLVVRALIFPALARLLGRWFWWPQLQPALRPPRTERTP
ncbi:RND family transporter [Mycobacterium sp. 3519A]|uniref:MMPL/RND family transporter n=1 Tax=Mycobacterium sp. 3519A TaxID=2057184 RepID=UPI000C7B8D8F|nr:RND family transporter [Mycobacterium sp. 3519A]